VRVTQFVFGPLALSGRLSRDGADVDKLRGIADQVTTVMRANPNMRQVTQDWGRARRRRISPSIKIVFA
jgi:hypothetical protein